MMGRKALAFVLWQLLLLGQEVFSTSVEHQSNIARHGDESSGFGRPARQLLASSDQYVQNYRQHPDCRGKNVMVCKSCSSQRLQGVRMQALEWPYDIWCIDSGDFSLVIRINQVWLQGDGGYENWQFWGCFTRSGTGGRNVHFTPVTEEGICYT